MYVIGMQQLELGLIAMKTGVVIDNMRPGRKKNSIEFHLLPRSGKYQRRGRSGRKVHAVCYHGYYEFMREIFERYPDAEVGSSVIVYKGRSQFNQTAAEVGAVTNPQNVRYDDLCDCEVK